MTRMTMAALAIVEAIEGMSMKVSAASYVASHCCTYTFPRYFLQHCFQKIDSQ